MSPVILVPDTNVLLAIGFGPKLDSKATRAATAVNLALGAQVRIIVPPSVARELARKLGEIDTVYDALQRLSQGPTEPLPGESALATAERLLAGLKEEAARRVVRFADAIDVMVSEKLTSTPDAPLVAVFASVAGQALMLKEAITARSRPGYAEFPDLPEPDSMKLEPPIPQVSGEDLAHIRSAQALGVQHHCKAILVCLEKPMLQRKAEIESRFDHVVITSPPYVGAYLTTN